MRIIQYRNSLGGRGVALVEADGDHARELTGVGSIYELAEQAMAKKQPLAELIGQFANGKRIDYAGLLASGHVLAPLDHPEPTRFFITGTGLSHIGSASARNKMHVMTHGNDAPESDSMKIFRMGVEGRQARQGQDRRGAGVVLQGHG